MNRLAATRASALNSRSCAAVDRAMCRDSPSPATWLINPAARFWALMLRPVSRRSRTIAFCNHALDQQYHHRRESDQTHSGTEPRGLVGNNQITCRRQFESPPKQTPCTAAIETSGVVSIALRTRCPRSTIWRSSSAHGPDLPLASERTSRTGPRQHQTRISVGYVRLMQRLCSPEISVLPRIVLVRPNLPCLTHLLAGDAVLAVLPCLRGPRECVAIKLFHLCPRPLCVVLSERIIFQLRFSEAQNGTPCCCSCLPISSVTLRLR